MRREDVVFYDFSFVRLAQLKEYISVNAELRYCEYGTFEVHLPLNAENVAELLCANEFLLCRYGDIWAVVTGWRIGEDIAVFGRTPEWLLTKRCVEVFSKEDIAPSKLAEYAVENGAGDFAAVSEYTGDEEKISYSTDKVRTVYDTVREALSESGLGFRVRVDFEAKGFSFEVYGGTERSRSISASELTAYDMTYTADFLDKANSGGWYERGMKSMGTWNAKKNSPTLSNSKAANAYTYYRITGDEYTRFGFSCEAGSYIYSDTEKGTWKIAAEAPRSVWVKITDEGFEGAKRWETVLSGQMTAEEARAELNGKRASASCETEVRRMEYGTDYALGDIVRVRFEFGSFRDTVVQRVCGIMLYADENGSGTRPELEKPSDAENG